MKKAILAIMALVLTAAPAFASSFTTKERAMAVFQFDSRAFGKDVQSVFVHTGLGIKGYGYDSGESWYDVQDIPMERSRNGFFAKAILDATYGGNSGGGQRLQGVWAQYWVTFTDGSQLVTKPFLHAWTGTRSPISLDANGRQYNAYREALIALIRAQSAPRTMVEYWSHDGSDVAKADAELASQIREIRRHR